jgi:heptosyltransferase-2
MIRRIAVFMPNWIGDAVMATPTLRALRRHFGSQVEIFGILQAPIAELLSGMHPFDALWLREDANTSPRLDWRVFASRLRSTPVDLSVHLTNDFASALAARLGNVPERVGYVRNRRGWLLTKRLVPPSRAFKRLPIALLDYYLGLAYAVGCEREPPTLELATTAREEEDADRAWAALGLAPGDAPVVLNSSGRYGGAKLWPERHCVALASRIARELALPVVVLCGPAERERAARIAAAAGHPRVRSLDGAPLSIGLTKATLRRARCLVSTDSGPRHIGAAFGIPVIALFGPTDPAWSDTHYDGEVRLVHPVECQPCAQRECPLRHHACMEGLEVDRVFDAVARAVGHADAAVREAKVTWTGPIVHGAHT